MDMDTTININEAIDKVLTKKLDSIVELEKLRRMEYLSADDVAKLFSLEKNTLNTQRSRGVGPPYVKIGAKVLYPVEGVREYMKSHLIKTLPQF